MTLTSLSVRQPYAQLLVRGIKRFEARTWSSTFRGRLWIHASSKAPNAQIAEAIDGDEYFTAACYDQGWFTLDELKALPRSAVVGYVDVLDVAPGRKWQASMSETDSSLCGGVDGDTILWEVAGAVEIAPVLRVDGKLNLWSLPDDVARRAGSSPKFAQRPATSWSLSDATDEWFAGFYRRRLNPPADTIPGCDTDSPKQFWRAFGRWVDSLDAPTSTSVVKNVDNVVKALQPTGKRTRQSVVSRALSCLTAELDPTIAHQMGYLRA